MQIDHAKILNAYLSRFTINDLEGILQAKYACVHSQQNYGNSNQLTSQDRFFDAVTHAINNLIKHDINLIENVISKETTK